MRKIIISTPPSPDSRIKTNCVKASNILVSDDWRIIHASRIENKITRNAWVAIDITLRECPKDSENYWIQRSPIQAIELVRDLATIGGGSIRLKEAKQLVDIARAGDWTSLLEDVMLEIY